MGLNWSEQRDSRMCVQLVLLACGIAFNVLLYILCEVWPPEFQGNKLASFEIPGVANDLMIMATSEDGTTERVVGENINLSFVCEDMVIILPV